VGAPKQPKRKYRRRSPWGGAFGKPIENLGSKFVGEPLGGQLSQDARQQQYEKMLRLKKHYGIEGESGWKPWYELALAIASEFDQGFRVVPAPPAKAGKTAPRWRGVHGLQLLNEVDVIRGILGKDEKLISILERLRHADPRRYGKMEPEALEARYYDAQKHWRTTKQNKNRR
jgi:hypothetical protein